MMASPRFYAGPDPLRAGQVELSKAESQHAKLARRLTVDDEVVLFDGRGAQGSGRIVDVQGPTIFVEVASVVQREYDAPLRLTLAVAPPKGPRQDVLVEKCTEIGVAGLWPMICEHSIVRPSVGRLAKWRRTAIEACKQSQRAWLPQVGGLMTFDEVITRCGEFDSALLAESKDRPAGALVIEQGASILAMIGPEGGFSEQELARAEAAGIGRVRLTQTILRTETAAIVAAAHFLKC